MSPALDHFYTHPIFGAGITVIAFAIGLQTQRRWSWAQPVVITTLLIIGTLLLLRIPYASYKIGGDLISTFLAPATVALAVPFYHHAKRIRHQLRPILIACTLGAIFGILSAGLVAHLAQLPREVILALLPKSATAPISMEVARHIGGKPELAALASVLSGLLGSIIGLPLLRRLHINADIPTGTAIGTSSHGLGTARLLRESEYLGSISALAMALTGIITALFTPLLKHWPG
ncbi:LrgB family protein [Phragmitibacter flavus]|uniref:LrgB family protein n=1 Tax=Phragmitibacter flavus TaxID=2576071 RepID=A0A5R8KIL6_9BACT|nr:LrgB family protein [Phragmitibacter flavus]TLD72154.1 LrgB family protein [Phragmitibacter flavus]